MACNYKWQTGGLARVQFGPCSDWVMSSCVRVEQFLVWVDAESIKVGPISLSRNKKQLYDMLLIGFGPIRSIWVFYPLLLGEHVLDV